MNIVLMFLVIANLFCLFGIIEKLEKGEGESASLLVIISILITVVSLML